MLIGIILEWVGAEGELNSHAVVEGTENILKFNFFRAVSITTAFRTFLFAERNMTGVVYVDMKEFLLADTNFEEECPNNMPLEQDGAPHHSHPSSLGLVGSKIFKENN
jgi:hypothetical protein